jgi:peptidoglycan/xylan/chitin deacetylase (PgdA/CDA1 family)
LSTLTRDQAISELSESRRLIEKCLGGSCELFSYPNGAERDFTSRDQELLRNLGYGVAVSQISGFNAEGANLMELRRFNIGHDRDFNLFLAKISGIWLGLNWLRSKMSPKPLEQVHSI